MSGTENNAIATIVDDDGTGIQLQFDCHGNYIGMDLRYPGNRWHKIPSRSVVAELSRVSCKAIGRT